MTDLLPLIQSRVSACTSCRLHALDGSSGPVPYRGPASPRIVFMGEAPGDVENAEGLPFIGPAGKGLRALCKQAKRKIDPDACGYMNVVSCWPGKTKKGYATPDSFAITACRMNMKLQLLAVEPRVVVVLGGSALNALRPDLQVSKDRGRPMVFYDLLPGAVFVPTYHPSAVLRAKVLGPDVESDLSQAKWRSSRARGGSDRNWPEDCRVCGEDVDVYDVNGVAWCKWHAPEGEPGGDRAAQPELEVS